MIAAGIDPGRVGAVVVIERVSLGQPWAVRHQQDWRRHGDAPTAIFAALDGRGVGVVGVEDAELDGRRDRSLSSALTTAKRMGEAAASAHLAAPRAVVYQAPAKDWRASLLGCSLRASGEGTLAQLRRLLAGRGSAMDPDRPDLAVMGVDWAIASEHLVEATGLALWAAQGPVKAWRWDRVGSNRARRVAAR